MTAQPILVALCGPPGVGKSTVQTILQKLWGIAPVDDGALLRLHVMEIADLSWEDVSTEEGKSRLIELFGQTWQVRDLLGKYGQKLEEMFGDNVVAEMALRRAMKTWRELSSDPRLLEVSPKGFSFGSVRRRQGQIYRDRGGVVVEIAPAGSCVKHGVTSGYDFDLFDPSLTDFRIENDGRSIRALEHAVRHSELARWIGDRLAKQAGEAKEQTIVT